MSENEFSVWIFTADETHCAEARWIGAEAAVKLAKEITLRPAAQLGLIREIRIVDSADDTVFQWKYQQGVVFPLLTKDGP